MTHFVNPKEVGGDLVQYLVSLTAVERITASSAWATSIMRQALGAAIAAGCRDHRRGRLRQEIKTRPFSW